MGEILEKIKFWKKVFDSNCKINYNFFTQEDFKINSYRIMEKYKYVVTMNSTLAIENFAKKNKTGFFQQTL